jgi:hypothetical protein
MEGQSEKIKKKILAQAQTLTHKVFPGGKISKKGYPVFARDLLHLVTIRACACVSITHNVIFIIAIYTCIIFYVL